MLTKSLDLIVGEGHMDQHFQKQQIQNTADDDGHRQELLRRRLQEPEQKKQFRTAYAFKAGADYSTLKPHCENIVVVLDGNAEAIDIVRAKLELALADYDSDKDVLVTIGRSIDNLMTGLIIAEKVRQKPVARQSFAIAVYYGFSYRFYQVYLDPTVESHRILF